ncbi:MAG TPA: tetratricopeptide repeat protein, partial [Taishania sp.]|nr:tetratricopeptide repeat protein [Taishania sp.]
MIKHMILVASILCCTTGVYSQEDVKVLSQTEVEQLKTQMPLAAETAYNEGILAFQAKNYTVAAEKYSAAINAYPAFEMAFYNRGLCYEALKNNDNALADFQKAVELNPNNSDALYKLSSMYDATGNKEKSEEYLNKAIA